EFHRSEDRDRYGGEELPFAVATQGLAGISSVFGHFFEYCNSR
ncbi:28284_t:CDS:2, partial [Racocetra persica]